VWRRELLCGRSGLGARGAEPLTAGARRTGVRLLQALLATVLVTGLAACGDAAEPEQRLAQEPAVTAGGSAAARAPGSAPLLQLTSRCYGMCAYVDPLGLPEVALYDDGTVVRAERPDPMTPVRLVTGSTDPRTVERLVDLARAARLVGGERTLLTFPEGPFFADGGAEVLTSRLDGETTTVESPQAYDAQHDDASSDPEQRRGLRELAGALRELEASTAYDETRAVLYAEALDDTGQEPRDWPGPALADLPAAQSFPPAAGERASQQRCAVLDGQDAEAALRATAQDAFPGAYRDGGVLWSVQVRLPLPHEEDCEAVADTVRAASAGTTPPG
jgi:hypothetical protein